VLLLLCATIAQQFKVKSPKHQSYYTTTIFFFAGAVLLRPAYFIVIILAAHAVELLRVRYRWYIPAFNVANFLLCSARGWLDSQSEGPACCCAKRWVKRSTKFEPTRPCSMLATTRWP
jgi:hypothetical protein